jgi:hypothetical protein
MRAFPERKLDRAGAIADPNRRSQRPLHCLVIREIIAMRREKFSFDFSMLEEHCAHFAGLAVPLLCAAHNLTGGGFLSAICRYQTGG